MNEVEVTFVADQEGADVILEFDRRGGHGGYGHGGPGTGAMAAGVAAGVAGGMILGEVAEDSFEDDGGDFEE